MLQLIAHSLWFSHTCYGVSSLSHILHVQVQASGKIIRCRYVSFAAHVVRETHLKLCLHTEGGVQRDHGH